MARTKQTSGARPVPSRYGPFGNKPGKGALEGKNAKQISAVFGQVHRLITEASKKIVQMGKKAPYQTLQSQAELNLENISTALRVLNLQQPETFASLLNIGLSPTLIADMAYEQDSEALRAVLGGSLLMLLQGRADFRKQNRDRLKSAAMSYSHRARTLRANMDPFGVSLTPTEPATPMYVDADSYVDSSLGSPMEPAGLVPQATGRASNFYFGNVTARITQSASEGSVPIFNVAVNMDVTNEQMTWADAFHEGYQAAITALRNGRSRLSYDINLAYAQVRLVKLERLMYDVVTPMVPIGELSTEFLTTLEMALQSKDAEQLPYHEEFMFRFTFVFPQGIISDSAVVITAASLFRQGASGVQGVLNQRTTNRRFNLMQEFRESGNLPYLDRHKQLHVTLARQDLQARRKEEGRKRAPKRPAERPQAAERVRVAPEAVKRTRAPLTDEQRKKYNETRKIKYHMTHNQSSVHGVYEDLKRRIFHHSNLTEFFKCSKAVLTIPNTHTEGYCLAMAVMRSEIRSYNMTALEIAESATTRYPSDTHLPFPIDFPYQDFLKSVGDFPFLKVDEGVATGYLFNAYRHKRVESELDQDDLVYSSSTSPAEVQAWYKTAQAFHHFVESRHDRSEVPSIDPNKEESCLQAYANVLGIIIAVYRLEIQGRRSSVYMPEYLSPDLRTWERVHVVSVLISEGHATSITSLREFLKSRGTANRSNVYNYCLFCEEMSTANNESVEKAKEHFAECCEKHSGQLKSCAEKVAKRMMVGDCTAKQFTYRPKHRDYVCRTCNQPVEDAARQHEHLCLISKPDHLPTGASSEIYVYDMECAQIYDGQNDVFKHKVNLVCVRKAYEEGDTSQRECFYNIEDFMSYVMRHTAEKRIYLAHNGGRYDVQFVIRHLEANMIPHSFVPAPSSIHAYLSVTISFGAKCEATFLDFRNFMPGSLKNIGISFGLDVTKGTFPHRFNDGSTEEYIGPLPIIDHVNDYWCITSMRTEEEVDDFTEWYAEQVELYCTCVGECVCDKGKWSFREEITRYCWLDVDVLAEAVVKYRDNALSFGADDIDGVGWQSKGIDPFQYVTIPQMAVNLLLSGLPPEQNITITTPKTRTERHPLAIAWMERLITNEGYHIHHIGNSNTEFFCLKTNRFLDGVDRRRGQYFVCLNCEFHGCQECFFNESETGENHPSRPGTYSMVYQDTFRFLQTLFKSYGANNVHVTWSHDLVDYNAYETELGQIMAERDMFYGGRTEVFSPYANVEHYPDDDLKYHDVCSLYPYVCAFKDLPTGEPRHICGTHIERERLVDINHRNPYFGYVRCQVTPNRQDVLGLLPFRDPITKRLDFPLGPMTGSWGTEELRLAIQNGYIIGDIYEVYHWGPNERSDTTLRGYVAFFLRMKQEAEGWRKLGASSEEPTDEEQDEIVAKVYTENGSIARVRKEQVAKNPVKRQMAKLFLNSLWGKFCQKPHKENFVTIYGYKQFAALWYNPQIDRSKFCFRHLSGNTWKVKYCTIDSFTKPNVKYNIFLASKVTEWARCILHRQMLKIGPSRILYCDTDSIMFLWPKTSPKLDGCGLGNWVDEYPRERILKLYAISPKFYYLVFEGGDNLLKSKGIQLTLENSRNLKEEKLSLQLQEFLYPQVTDGGEKVPLQTYMYMKNMIIGVNSTNSRLAYGSMLTRYTEDKKVSPTFTKRNIVTFMPSPQGSPRGDMSQVPRIFTIPKNFAVPGETLARHLTTHGFFADLELFL